MRAARPTTLHIRVRLPLRIPSAGLVICYAVSSFADVISPVANEKQTGYLTEYNRNIEQHCDKRVGASVSVVYMPGPQKYFGPEPSLPPLTTTQYFTSYGRTSKNYVIRVCFHCHGTSSYHTTNTLQGRRAKSHVDTQTIQPGLGDFVL